MLRASRILLRVLIVSCLIASSGILAARASASQLISNVATHKEAATASIKVNRNGIANLSFMKNGRVQHILARGAINALPPTQGGKQVSLKLDYKGGWGFFRDATFWKDRFGANVCGPYEGDPLPWLIFACTTPDGSNWAVQSWQRRLLCYGRKSPAKNRVWELRLSHWNTELPQLVIHMDWQSWGNRHYDHLWGRFTYLGNPVYGFKSTKAGAPLDTWGRNVYLDTFNSVYGPGWKHENAFLTHDPTGNFCYAVTKHPPYPAGTGEKYRATVVGPGVTPDVMWTGNSPGPYDPVLDAQANAQEEIDLAGDTHCVIR